MDMIFEYQTPMCDKAIQQLKDSGLFDNEIFDMKPSPRNNKVPVGGKPEWL